MAPLQPRSQQSTAPQSDQLQIQHFTHQHLLQKLFAASEFNCNGCKIRGQGIRYRCSVCDFNLHEQCATSPHHLSSHLHPHHQLILVNRPGNSHFCDVCKGFADGLSYTCQMCEFDVHPLCAQKPVVSAGVPSSTLSGQQGGVMWVQPTAAVGGYPGLDINRPVMINQQQGMPTADFGGYNGVNINSNPVMMNHQLQQHQGMPTASFSGYQGVNNSQPVMMNHQQLQQGMPTTAFVGYEAVNNSQPVMMNHQQQQQGMPTTAFGGYNNSHPMMINQNQQQQGIPTMKFGGYHGANSNSQLTMVNHHQQQYTGMATTAFGGYNNSQPMMMNHHQQQQPPARSNSLSKVGKLAASVLMTSLIGVPINFNSKK